MKQTFPLYAAVFGALLALAACNDEPEIVDTNPDPQAAELAKAAPVEVPPMIQASRTYRCKDNSLLYVEFLTDNSARVRTEKDGAPTILTAAGGQPPYVAEGYSLSANSTQIEFTAPGKGSLACKA